MGLTREQAFPSRFLKQEHLPHPTRAVIGDVQLEAFEYKQGERNKPVLSFAGDTLRPFPLNATNWDVLAAAYGPNVDLWAGKPVEAYVDSSILNPNGQRTGGIRLRIPAGAPVITNTGGGRGMAQPPATLTWEQALALAATAGMDKAALIAALKAHGKNEYRPSRDTAAVQEIVAAAEAARDAAEDVTETGFDDMGDVPTGDAVPF